MSPRKEISTPASIEGRNQVTPTHYISRIDKTESKFICGFYKANFWQACSTKSRTIAWYLAKPTDPKKIHTPDVSGTRNHRILSPNVGMIYPKNSCIPVGFSSFFVNGRAQHNIWVCMGVDGVALPLSVVA